MNKQDIIEQVSRAIIDQLRQKGIVISAPDQLSDASAAVIEQEERIRSIMAAGACRLSTGPGAKRCQHELANLIDHTLLKPEATDEAIRQLCREARQFGFASVCVNPVYVPLCSELLAGSPVKVCTVVGFPLGANTTEAKAFETGEAVRRGAAEIDMVIHIGALKSQKYQKVEDDIRAVVEAAKPNTVVKVIIETALLTDEEKIKACILAKEAGAHFVKTSTGFGPGGAKAEDIWLMRRVVGSTMGVKASGGVRDFEYARQFVNIGASRIGASAGIKIVGN